MADIVPIKRHKAFVREQKATIARTLRQAKDIGFTEIFIIGFDRDGEIRVQGHPPDPGNAMYLMEMAKQKLTGLR